jgi:hypothetical protein
MIPTLKAFQEAHGLTGITVVADAGMVSAGNQKAIEDAGLSFILGAKVPDVPYVVKTWREAHPGEELSDGQIFTQPWPAGPTDKRGDQMIYYQYRADRARRSLHGIDEQVTKAEKAVAGKIAVKRNRFVRLSGAEKSVNRELETKTRALAGIQRLCRRRDYAEDCRGARPVWDRHAARSRSVAVVLALASIQWQIENERVVRQPSRKRLHLAHRPLGTAPGLDLAQPRPA